MLDIELHSSRCGCWICDGREPDAQFRIDPDEYIAATCGHRGTIINWLPEDGSETKKESRIVEATVRYYREVQNSLRTYVETDNEY